MHREIDRGERGPSWCHCKAVDAGTRSCFVGRNCLINVQNECHIQNPELLFFQTSKCSLLHVTETYREHTGRYQMLVNVK